jgi:hypothetical protein
VIARRFCKNGQNLLKNESEWDFEDSDSLIETDTMFSNIADRFYWILLESHDHILLDFKYDFTEACLVENLGYVDLPRLKSH